MQLLAFLSSIFWARFISAFSSTQQGFNNSGTQFTVTESDAVGVGLIAGLPVAVTVNK
jgi:hypothetical protein